MYRNAWSSDRHARAVGGSSSTSSNERTYTINRRAKHHRVYNSYRQPSRTLHKGVGGGATTDPDALSSVTTAGVKYGQQPPPPPQQLHHQSQHQLHHNRPQMVAATAAVAWPSESSAVHHQQPAVPPPNAAVAHYLPPLLPPQNAPATAAAAAVPRQPALATGLPTAATRHHQHLHTATVPLLLSSGDVAVDACGGHCPRFENFCHFCLLVSPVDDIIMMYGEDCVTQENIIREQFYTATRGKITRENMSQACYQIFINLKISF